MNEQTKNLLNSKAWAIDAPSNRADIDDPNITPTLQREEGFGIEYSQSSGTLPDRRDINTIFCETTSAAKETVYGICPYDGEVNYPKDAITNVRGVLYRAKIANGPSTSNVTNPITVGQIIWEKVTGSLRLPDKPENFVGDNSIKNTIIAQWKSGKDNGAKITSWKFDYVEADQDFPSNNNETTLQYPYYKITNLLSNVKYKVRAAGVNEVGTGEWGYSVVGANGFTTQGSAPDGGDALSLRAVPGNKEATVRWNTPPDNGSPITQYTLQWKKQNEIYNSVNQTTTDSNTLTYNVKGLDNNVEYSFRVNATNIHGVSDWSNIAYATPFTTELEKAQPILLSPSLRRNSNAINATARTTPSAKGVTEQITSYNWEYKENNNAIWSKLSGTGESVYVTTGSPGDTFQVRYKVTTDLGITGYSGISSISIPLPPKPPTPVSFRYTYSESSTVVGYFVNRQYIVRIWMTWARGSAIDQIEVKYNNSAGGYDNTRMYSLSSAERARLRSTGIFQVSLNSRSYGSFDVRARYNGVWGDWSRNNVIYIDGARLVPSNGLLLRKGIS